jgi:uncharacterized protein (UPF0335 family)
MSSREKTQSDIDLETLVDLFDTAMSSDNPAVKKAFKNLLLVSTIVNSELSSPNIIKGPLRQLTDDFRNIVRRIETLESERYNNINNIKPTPFVWQTGTGTGFIAKTVPNNMLHVDNTGQSDDYDN